MSELAFDESKCYLQQSGPDGVSLYDHLSELVLQLVEQRPDDALEKIEEFSRELKKSAFIQKPIQEAALDENKAPTVLDRIKHKFNEQSVNLIKETKATNQTSSSTPLITDSMDESFYFSRMGIGLGQEELTQIILHMKQYFISQPMKSVRFFGKIYGVEKNYYVVEAEPNDNYPSYDEDFGEKETGLMEEKAPEVLNDEEADPDEPPSPKPKPAKPEEIFPKEPRKEMTPNQFVYFVCHEPGDEWVRLPDVTPDMIRKARLLSKTLTGDLEAPVSEGFPFFPGKEKHFLRAQLARISHSTTLLPRRLAGGGEGEEAEEAEEAGEGKVPIVDVATLNEEAAWVHARPPILVQGRVEKWPPPKAEGEEEEAEAEEGEEKESPFEVWEGEDDPNTGRNLKLKKGIEEDKKLLDGQIPSFSIKKDTVLDESPILLRSNYWPGAYTLAYGGRKAQITSIYIGWGKKYTTLPFTMPPPPVIPEEHPEMDEQIDPTVDEEDRAQAAQEESAASHREEEEEEEEEEEG
ncbi:putative radial spoke head protein 6 [Monocercomonoides exilis]|uniref:putative radial spoke head protein 6 n=1 Tax=Monocercomonoides exilis TaxID=2049356 RepID=UPI00355983BE|nr:putative radial spoke head protein 6 [Monocercomonoides exilis]